MPAIDQCRHPRAVGKATSLGGRSNYGLRVRLCALPFPPPKRKHSAAQASRGHDFPSSSSPSPSATSHPSLPQLHPLKSLSSSSTQLVTAKRPSIAMPMPMPATTRPIFYISFPFGLGRHLKNCLPFFTFFTFLFALLLCVFRQFFPF